MTEEVPQNWRFFHTLSKDRNTAGRYNVSCQPECDKIIIYFPNWRWEVNNGQLKVGMTNMWMWLKPRKNLHQILPKFCLKGCSFSEWQCKLIGSKKINSEKNKIVRLGYSTEVSKPNWLSIFRFPFYQVNRKISLWQNFKILRKKKIGTSSWIADSFGKQ